MVAWPKFAKVLPLPFGDIQALTLMTLEQPVAGRERVLRVVFWSAAGDKCLDFVPPG
jgi:hypothetical protein